PAVSRRASRARGGTQTWARPVSWLFLPLSWLHPVDHSPIVSINDIYMCMTERLLDHQEPSQGLYGDRMHPPIHLHLQRPLVVDRPGNPLHFSPWQQLRSDPRADGTASGPVGSKQRLNPSVVQAFQCREDGIDNL